MAYLWYIMQRWKYDNHYIPLLLNFAWLFPIFLLFEHFINHFCFLKAFSAISLIYFLHGFDWVLDYLPYPVEFRCLPKPQYAEALNLRTESAGDWEWHFLNEGRTPLSKSTPVIPRSLIVTAPNLLFSLSHQETPSGGNYTLYV